MPTSESPASASRSCWARACGFAVGEGPDPAAYRHLLLELLATPEEVVGASPNLLDPIV